MDRALRIPILLTFVVATSIAWIVQVSADDERASRPGDGRRAEVPADGGSESRGRRDRGKRYEENRRRWGQLSEEKRRKIRAFHDRFKRIDPRKRRELMARLRQLDPERRKHLFTQIAGVSRLDRSDRAPAILKLREGRCLERDAHAKGCRRLQRKLPDHLRERLAKLSPQERQSELKKFLGKHKELQQRRQTLIAELPASVRETVKDLPPERQTPFLRRYMASKVFERTFSDEERGLMIQQLKSRQLRELLEKDSDVRPEYFPESAWARWRGLERFQRERLVRYLHHLQSRRGGSGKSCDHRRGDRKRSGGRRREPPSKERSERRADPELRSRSPSDSSRSGSSERSRR